MISVNNIDTQATNIHHRGLTVSIQVKKSGGCCSFPALSFPHIRRLRGPQLRTIDKTAQNDKENSSSTGADAVYFRMRNHPQSGRDQSKTGHFPAAKKPESRKPGET